MIILEGKIILKKFFDMIFKLNIIIRELKEMLVKDMVNIVGVLNFFDYIEYMFKYCKSIIDVLKD